MLTRPVPNFDDEAEDIKPRIPPLSFVRILWKRRVQILISWFVLSVIAVTTVMLWPANYRAEALILVDSQKIPEKFVSATVSADLQDRLATISQRTILASALILVPRARARSVLK